MPPNEGYWSEGWPAYGNLGNLFTHVPHDSMLYFDVRCVELRAEPWWGRRGGLASEAVPPPTRFMTAPSEREARMVAP